MFCNIYVFLIVDVILVIFAVKNTDMFNVGDFVSHYRHGFGVIREVREVEGIYVIYFNDLKKRRIKFSDDMKYRENKDYVIIEKSVTDIIHVHFKTKDGNRDALRERFSVSRFNELIDMDGKVWDDGVKYYLFNVECSVISPSYSNYSSKFMTVEYRDTRIYSSFTFCDEYMMEYYRDALDNVRANGLFGDSVDFAAFVYEKYQERIRLKAEN